MTRKSPSDLAASVRHRLRNLARTRNEDPQLILIRYGIERLLYRLSRSDVRDQFVLKGAILFQLWESPLQRPTRDVDFLVYGDSALDSVAAAFREICQMEVEPDGLVFHSDTITAEPIREAQEYDGVRVRMRATLGTARIPIQVDLGFGDAVTPAPEISTFPTLLDFPAPQVRTYPAETVIAEKFQAMVALGAVNSRMKDFYDVWALSEVHPFEGTLLSAALAATFARRSTPLPEQESRVLNEALSTSSERQQLWESFIARAELFDAPQALPTVTERIVTFLLPPTMAAGRGETFQARWLPGDSWHLTGR
jgi:predicted nucleotidyltransferase component of viral defense system